MSKEKKNKKFAVPHQLIIILIIAFLAMIATYLIPAGQYLSLIHI